MAHFIYRTIGTGASGASPITVILMLKWPRHRHRRLRLRSLANLDRPRAFIPKPAAWRRCPSRLVPRQIKSPWAGASSTARLQAAPASAVTATTRKARRRHRRLSLANGLTATAAYRGSRGPLRTVCRSQSIFPFQCRRAVARRCPIPMSPPSPLMSGPSAIRQGSSFRSNGTASKSSRVTLCLKQLRASKFPTARWPKT